MTDPNIPNTLTLPNADLINKPDTTPSNRALDTKIEDIDREAIFVTLESIDEIIVNHLINVIKPTIVDNDRVIPVPIIYASPERWKAIRKDGYLRDPMNEKAQTPLITIRRINVERNSQMTNPSNKYVYLNYHTNWNRRNAYDQFAVLNGIHPSQELKTVIVPDYVNLTYQVYLWTEYVTQMNKLIEQLNVENEEYWGQRNNYKFRVRIENYPTDSSLPAEDTRTIRTDFRMMVAAYLLPERMVKNFDLISTNSKTYTSKKTILFTEFLGTGQKP